MQSRHIDRDRYFCELAKTSEKYYVDYVNRYKTVDSSIRVLEIGCGEGGNLLPFARAGASVYGVDLSKTRIEQATVFFEKQNVMGVFQNIDFLKMEIPDKENLFDVILVHDVIEHIEPENKNEFVGRIKLFLRDRGIVFFRFPAWQMPFGGHQQICKSIVSKIPFAHLLPYSVYKRYLEFFGESNLCVEELLSIKRSRVTVEKFESLCKKLNYKVLNRTLWFINPHYKVKFNIPAIKLNFLLRSIYYLRNYFTTSCFYLITPK